MEGLSIPPPRGSRDSRAAFGCCIIAILLMECVISASGATAEPTRTAPSPPEAFLGYRDEFDTSENITLEGDAILVDGRVELAFEIDFADALEGPSIAPWTVSNGSASADHGNLTIEAPAGSDARVVRGISREDSRVEGRLMRESASDPGFEVGFDLSQGWAVTFEHDSAAGIVRGFSWPPGRSPREECVTGCRIATSTWYDFAAEVYGGNIRFEIDGKVLEFHLTTSYHPSAIELACPGGGRYTFRDIVGYQVGAGGSVTSVPIALPPDCRWDTFALGDTGPETVPGLTGCIASPSRPIGPSSFRTLNESVNDIHALDFNRYPTIVLQARLGTSSFRSPVLENWSVTWKVGRNLWVDGFDWPLNISSSDKVVHDFWGHLSFGDRREEILNKSDISPWTVYSPNRTGNVSIASDGLTINAANGTDDWLGIERPIDLRDLIVSPVFDVRRWGSGGINISFIDAHGRSLSFHVIHTGYKELVEWRILWWDGAHLTELMEWSGSDGLRFPMDYRLTIQRDGLVRMGFVEFRYHETHVDIPENFTTCRIVAGPGSIVTVPHIGWSYAHLNGTAVSTEIPLPPGMGWRELRLKKTQQPTTLVTVDVLDGRTWAPVPGYTDVSACQLDLSGVDPSRHPTLRLRLSMTTYTGTLPNLDWWEVWWEPEDILWMEPFDDGGGVDIEGGARVSDGRLESSNVLLEDAFDRFDVASWSRAGRVDDWDGHLWLPSGPSTTSVAGRDFVPVTQGVAVVLAFMVPSLGQGPLLLRLDGGDGWYDLECDPALGRLGLVAENASWGVDSVETTLRMAWDTWYGLRLTDADGVVSVRVDGAPVLTWSTGRVAGHSVRGLEVVCGGGTEALIDDLVVASSSMDGTALTMPIPLPTDATSLRLTMVRAVPIDSALRASVVDAATLEPVAGFQNLPGGPVDLSTIDTATHPSIRLRFEISGLYAEVPSVDWVKIHRSGVSRELFLKRGFDDIIMMEDTPLRDVLDVTGHFGARGIPEGELAYEVSSVANPLRVLPVLEGHFLSMDLPTANWWGRSSFRLRASWGDLALETEDIRVIVLPVDDPPVLLPLGELQAREDDEAAMDLGPFIVDVDTTASGMTVTVDDARFTVEGTSIRALFTEGGLDLIVRVTVSDGTSSTSGELLVHVVAVDDPPRVMDVGTLRAMAGEPLTVDLGPYISDEDTPASRLAIASDSPALVSISGLNLTLLFPFGGVTRTVAFTVADGTSTVAASFSVEVIRGNRRPDLPIIETPLNHSKVVLGDDVSFRAFVGDPDLPVGSPLNVTWSSNLTGVLRRESSNGSSDFLAPFTALGVHRITVTVDDGELSSSAWIEVTVVPPDRPPDGDGGEHGFLARLPGLPILAIIVIIIVSCGVTAAYLRSRSHQSH